MIHLIVDSTFGFSKEFAKQKGIEIVNLKLNLDNETVDEGFKENWDQFYEKIKNSKNFPTTSQPSPEDFIVAFKRIFKRDENAEIIVLTISERLSGTINSAVLASKSFKDKKILVIDSKQATVGSKIVAEEVIEFIESGKTLDEIEKEVALLHAKVNLLFVPATMEYLIKGGRIGTLAGTIASIFQIKPIFKFKEGILSVAKKVLGFGHSLAEMVSMLPKNLKKLYICYIHDNSNVQQLAFKLKKILNLEKVESVACSPVFGCHVGIGAVGFAAIEQ